MEFLKIIDANHPKIGRVVAKISQYITDRYNYDINDEEKLYLSMHISRLLNYKD
ncbi:PRD domain-containing protein [Anaerococcus sp. Marseille-P3915]|uniref:PRD domain-containing protein n=1 Tax=Anaerococcus sp. Marseille-P3915 TaxID=2057799 RepID=UPI000D0AE1F3|nr:PRD domain-containing protein [Anaerococcus sp. Marseille-P3915]